MDGLLDQRKILKSQLTQTLRAKEKHELEDKITKIESKIADKTASKYTELIKDHVGEVCTIEGKFNPIKVWKLKKKIFPKLAENATAKIGSNGELVTNPNLLKKLYLETFQKRLSHRVILPHLRKLKSLREELFQKRIQKAAENKSANYTEEDLIKVLKKLKPNKATDPMGFTNEMKRLFNKN